MHDTVDLESRGVPSVFVATVEFVDGAVAQARALGADVARYKKPTFTKPAPPDLRQQIAVHCDAVVEALAD